MPRLRNDTHERFARYYANHGHSRKAAAQAGLSAQSADAVYCREDVQARIRELSERMLKANDITAERVMLELARVGFADMRGIYREDGTLKHPHEFDDDTAATVAGIEFEEKFTTEMEEDLATGEMVAKRVPVRTAKVKRYDKNPALTTLAKHFKIVGDEGDGVNALATALADRLKTARKRTDGEPDESK